MGLRIRTIRGIAWSTFEQWGREGASFLVFLILSRLLTPEAFGIVAIASMIILFGQIIGGLGFGTAIIQRKEMSSEHLDAAFWLGIVVGCVLTLVTIGTSNLIGEIFAQPQLTFVARWLAIQFLLGPLGAVHEAVLSREMEFRALAIRTNVAVLISGVVGVTMAFMGFEVWSLVAQSLVSGVVSVIVLWWASDVRIRFRFSLRHARDLFGFGRLYLDLLSIHYQQRLPHTRLADTFDFREPRGTISAF